MPRTAEIIAVGSELLTGGVTNTNAAFLSRLLEIHLPACWARFEAIDIVDSGRMDGEQFIRAELKDMEGSTVYRAVLQVAPVGRLLRLERAAAAE